MQFFLYWLSIVGILLSGAAVLIRQRNAQYIFYSVFSFSLAVWLACQYFADTQADVALWLGIGFIATEVIAASFVAFVHTYPDRNPPKLKYTVVLLFPLVVFGPLSFSNLLIDSHQSSSSTNLDFGPLYWPQTITIFAYLLVSLGLLIWRLPRMKQQDRHQTFLLFGAFIPFLIGSILTGIVYSSNDNIQFLRPLSALIMVLIIIYSMIYKNFFDIRFFVVRALVYLLTTVVLGVLYVAPALFLLGTVVMGFPFDPLKFTVGVIIGTIAAVNYQKVRLWFDSVTSRVFFRDAYDSAQLLGELNRILVSSADINKMLHNSAELISKNIKPDFCLFALKETTLMKQRIIGVDALKVPSASISALIHNQKIGAANTINVNNLPEDLARFHGEILRSDIAIMVKLSATTQQGGDNLGYIILGFKKNGNPYTSQDIQTLETIADVMVIAIQNALQFEEIQKFNLTLQQKVNEATAQLRRTNAKLKALDETKDDFISMASHQLRTPLTSVKGYLSMVLEGDAGKLNSVQRKMLDQAFVSSQRMVFLIADLLNVSRLKTGKFIIEPSKVNLAQTVFDEVNQLKETAKNRSLELSYDKPADFPELMIDETKIRQVIMNFIDNAIYYTPAGGKIHIELKDTPVSVQFRVVDNGIGVPRREQPHLFTKFYRAGNARQARPDGTGLGLFMAKKVVVAQGGAVIFESQEGKGSTFGFIFPKQKLAVSSASMPAPVAASLKV